jgi:hypothetical protein
LWNNVLLTFVAAVRAVDPAITIFVQRDAVGRAVVAAIELEWPAASTGQSREEVYT